MARKIGRRRRRNEQSCSLSLSLSLSVFFSLGLLGFAILCPPRFCVRLALTTPKKITPAEQSLEVNILPSSVPCMRPSNLLDKKRGKGCVSRGFNYATFDVFGHQSMLRNSFVARRPSPARLFVHSCFRAWLRSAEAEGKTASEHFDYWMGPGRAAVGSSSSTTWHLPDPRPRPRPTSYNITREKKNTSTAQAFNLVTH